MHLTLQHLIYILAGISGLLFVALLIALHALASARWQLMRARHETETLKASARQIMNIAEHAMLKVSGEVVEWQKLIILEARRIFDAL